MKQFTYRKFILIFASFALVAGVAKSQSPSPLDPPKSPAADTQKKPAAPQNTLTFGLDMRVRTEWRHGYKSIPPPDTTGAYQINQRTRFNVDYKSKGLDVFLSLQDAKVWGQQDPREGQTGTSTT